MNLRQLEYLVALADEGSFGRAATRCNASQPAVSVAIAKLETELGVELVRRGTRGAALTPAGKAQTLYLTLDAGAAGRQQVPLKIDVPEPQLRVTTPTLEFGDIYPDEVPGEINVRNQGNSEFLGEARSDALWVSVQPGHFRCQPGGQRKLKVQVDARNLPFGQHVARIDVIARAGGWQQDETIPVRLGVSLAKVFWKHWAPPIVWVIGWTIFGSVFGYLLGWLGTSMASMLLDRTIAILSGVLYGALICVVPGFLLGLIGGMSGDRTSEGGRRGAILGLIVGAVAGVAGSYLTLQILPVIGLSAAAPAAVKLFGSLVGTIAGASFGLVLWLFAPEGFYPA